MTTTSLHKLPFLVSMESLLTPGSCRLSDLSSFSTTELGSVFLDMAPGLPRHVHRGDRHVGVVHGVLLGVELDHILEGGSLDHVVLLEGGGLDHVVLLAVLDDQEFPGVLWVRWMIGVA